MRKTVKSPTVFQSLIPVAVLIVLIGLNVTLLGDETLAGANQMSLLIASGVTACIAIRNGKTWGDILEGIVRTLTGAIPAILILLMIGVLSGTWMLSGIIPAMIHYGLYVLRPEYFLPATVVISALISLATGSSWSTVATVGVALLGIGRTLGFGDPVIAGAIISGAYFGDKVSPLSDTTNLRPRRSPERISSRISVTCCTRLCPRHFVTLIIFTILSIGGGKIAADVSVADTQRMITDYYYISPVLFLVPLAAVAMIVFKMPPVPVLFVGSLLGGVMAVVCQPELIGSLSGDGTLTAGGAYRVVSRAMYGTVSPETGDPMVDSLFTSRGMAGMLNTVWLIITAMIFGGVMEAGQFLERITTALIRRVRSTGGLVSATAGTCVLFNSTASDQYLAIVIPGKIFGSAYRRKGLAPEVLSRTLEDAGTATSVLIPWNTCGATQARRAERGDGRLPALRFFLLHQSADVDPVRLAGFAYPQNPAAGRFAGNGKSK